jgi:hypothetical protein
VISGMREGSWEGLYSDLLVWYKYLHFYDPNELMGSNLKKNVLRVQ